MLRYVDTQQELDRFDIYGFNHGVVIVARWVGISIFLNCW